MKNIATLGIILTALSVGCGTKKDRDSAVQSIATTANEQLIADIEAASEANIDLKLAYVLERKEQYGLSDKEVTSIQAAFTDDEMNRLVLSYVDPNNKRGSAAPQWAFVPDVPDNSEELKEISVIDEEGRKQLIDGTDRVEELSYPLITIGFSERIEGATQLQMLSDNTSPATPSAEGGLMIDTIHFKKDHEPWIKGKAEIYAVISYFDKSGKGASELVEMPSVDHDKKTYDLRQVVHLWPKNKYQIANIAFFEHDSNFDYSKLLKIFVTAAAAVVPAVIDPTKTTTIVVAKAVGSLADAIVDALPDGLLKDDDDYMDTVNTIEKYSPGTRSGVGGNVTLGMSYYGVKLNDE